MIREHVSRQLILLPSIQVDIGVGIHHTPFSYA